MVTVYSGENRIIYKQHCFKSGSVFSSDPAISTSRTPTVKERIYCKHEQVGGRHLYTKSHSYFEIYHKQFISGCRSATK